ncbi:MAG: cytochrome c [Deltaproteobacteria bacterium]|nr:cytochrome c [Deltaproteobacteria bacterium]MDH3384098.1 cytochrome c [Deltaproteobacteria bacterium]
MASWGNLQPLSTQFYSLLQHGLFLVLFFHLPFLGFLIGGSAVSLLLNFLGKEKRDPSYLRFSQELMRTVLMSKSALFLFGLVPLLLVWFAYARVLFDPSPLPWQFWGVLLAALIFGFAFLLLYRSARDRTLDLSPISAATGAAGLLALILAFFLFSAGYGILFNPSKLPLLQKQIQFFLSWNGVVKFLLFLAFFFGMTGAAILLLCGRSAEGGEGTEAGYRRLVHRFGANLTFLATLVLPVFLLLDLVTLPVVALSAEVFVSSAVVLLLSLAVCLTLFLFDGKGEGGPGARVVFLFVLIFLAMLLHDDAAVGNAYQDRVAFLAMQEAVMAETGKEAHREAPAATAQTKADAGKVVFETICAGCHRFDIRVVGPPLSEVVPKYGGDAEKLKAFIRAPVKVNPGYPSMPRLGLPEEEIDAVARYLIEKVKAGGSS